MLLSTRPRPGATVWVSAGLDQAFESPAGVGGGREEFAQRAVVQFDRSVTGRLDERASFEVAAPSPDHLARVVDEWFEPAAVTTGWFITTARVPPDRTATCTWSKNFAGVG